MFDSLSHKLTDIFRNMRGLGKMSEKNVADVVQAVKIALLEADVDYRVVKQFVADVKEKAVGQEVLRSVLPDQQFIKIVHDELTVLMGVTQVQLTKAPIGPTILMVVGIQGSGKTTACGKLAYHLKHQGHKVLLVPCDLARPAAVQQLKTLAAQAGVDAYSDERHKDPQRLVVAAMDYIKHKNYDYVILDTAGRLEVDEALMDELVHMKMHVKPHEILFVADAMMGQSALSVAQKFNERVGFDGVILTKLDGDARGGVALSVRKVLNKPLKFIGVGEKLKDLDVFYPDRMASRILGMGDVVSLVEKAKITIDEQEAKQWEKKIKTSGLDMHDFLAQLQQIKKMGSLKDIIGMLPGAQQLQNLPVDDKQLVRVEAIILSMTAYERTHPHAINGSRKKRIALGSGTDVQDVNRLLKQFDMMNKMMKKMNQGSWMKRFMPGGKGKGLPF